MIVCINIFLLVINIKIIIINIISFIDLSYTISCCFPTCYPNIILKCITLLYQNTPVSVFFPH